MHYHLITENSTNYICSPAKLWYVPFHTLSPVGAQEIFVSVVPSRVVYSVCKLMYSQKKVNV